MQKVILHMDGDAFFVGVEVAKNPKLRGRAVVTGQDRGIVSALSYEAKALGIVRGMPIYRVKKDFPKVLVLPGDYASYARYSEMMFDIVRRYADDVEEYSIDECFADLTGLEAPLKMTYREIALRIKREITEELGLSISVGVAPTKVLAKVASKWVKPNGFTVIGAGDISEYLAQTAIEKIWGIGGRTSAFLQKRGVSTAWEFADKDIGWVEHFLSKPYKTIWQELNGMPIMKVDSERKTVYSSIQKTRTFHPPTNDKTFLLSQFSKNIEDACTKARHFALAPKKLSIFLKTQNFKYFSCSVPLVMPTNAPAILIALARKQFKTMHTAGTLYRTTGVTLHELVSDRVSQADLFGDRNLADKFESIHKHLDHLEDKFGKRVVYLASTHKALQRTQLGTDSEDMDRNLLFL